MNKKTSYESYKVNFPYLKIGIILMGLMLSLVACQGDKFYEIAIEGTPARDLPISSDLSERQAIPTPVSADLIQEADADYILLTNIYERLAPSVVNIESNLVRDGKRETLRGSGFVINNFGHIVTNSHVIQHAEQIRVTFYDGFTTEAEMIGIDTYSDIAILKVDVAAEKLFPVIFGDSNQVRVGQRAITIGNPFGLNSSMTVGIISGVGRTLRSGKLIGGETAPDFENPSIIQTDAPINPGNSGGPLLNSAGEVIGINTAIRTESGVFEGVGFAIPANSAIRIVPELIRNGKVEYPWIGISVMPEEKGLSVSSLYRALNLPVQAGVLIRDIYLGSPADEAGLRGGDHFEQIHGERICVGGDIIVAVDGFYVNNMDDMLSYFLINKSPGDQVELLIVRGDESFSVPMVLSLRPDNQSERKGCP